MGDIYIDIGRDNYKIYDFNENYMILLFEFDLKANFNQSNIAACILMNKRACTLAFT